MLNYKISYTTSSKLSKLKDDMKRSLKNNIRHIGQAELLTWVFPSKYLI